MAQRLLWSLSLIILHQLVVRANNQVVRGRIIDNATHQAIPGASLSVSDSSSNIGTTSDSAGNFKLRMPLGRHYLRVSHITYSNLSIPLLVDAGKEVVLKIEMAEKIKELNEVAIAADQYEENKVQEIGRINFTIEEAQRNAANFNDPARLVIKYPGIAVVNDQANNISVHGNSPNTISWRLEGVDIVNPNHLINAGTLNDKIARSGGGVNILSSQLMGNSSFLTGPFPSEYGNALSGIFDINFRRGNNQRREYTTQASLYGIDLATEGPLSKSNNSSYLINYRYSTIALLSLMGVKLGDEDTRFQDLSMNFYFPTKNAGNFTIFGMGGLSSNKFITTRDSSFWESNKDHYDILFYSNMFATGITHDVSLGQKTFMRSAIAISGLQTERTGSFINDQYTSTLQDEDKLQESKKSLNTSISHKVNSKNTFKTGIYLTQLHFDMQTKENLIVDSSTTISGKGTYELLEPYVNFEHKFSEKLILNSGLHFMYFTLNKSASLEPRISLNWALRKNQSIGFGYGLHSMLQQPQVYFMLIPDAADHTKHLNSGLDFTKAHHFALSYNTKVFKELKFLTQVFYQYLFNIPIEKNTSSSFSTINVIDDWVSKPLVNKGTGENYGVDVSIEKFLRSKYYFIVSSSLYNSVYKGSDGVSRNTRFNGNYTMAVVCGREASMKNDNTRTIGSNLRLLYMGGQRTTPIDPLSSSIDNTTFFIQSQAFTTQMADFYRIDFRFSVKKNKVNYTRTWAIDIQNLTNRQNIASQYYDAHQKKVVSKYQNGLIPILSYRVDF